MITKEDIEAVERFVQTAKGFKTLWKNNKHRLTTLLKGAAKPDILQQYLKQAIYNRNLLGFIKDNKNVVFESTDELRQLAIKNGLAYTYARYIDKCARDDTRAAALRSAPYLYARYVDQCGRDDTRNAALKKGGYGYLYARYVDNCARDDTRKNAIENGCGYEYAFYVDKHSRDDTRAAACKKRHGYQYARDVDKCARQDTALASGEYAAEYATLFYCGKPTPETRKAVLNAYFSGLLRYIKTIEGTGSDAYRQLVCKKFPYEALLYAVEIDKGPHDLTRAAACKNGRALEYALAVDKCPHDMTREYEESQPLEYAVKVDNGPHPVTFLRCLERDSDYRPVLTKYLNKFGDPKEWMPKFLTRGEQP